MVSFKEFPQPGGHTTPDTDLYGNLILNIILWN